MLRLLAYIGIFIVGFAVSFVGIKLFDSHSTQKTDVSNTQIPTSTANSTLPGEPAAVEESVPKEENTTDSVSFMEGTGEDIELIIDTSLAPLSKIGSDMKALKKACKIPYPQYQNKNRYQWAKSYTLSKTQTQSTLDFYVQDDIWSSFSTAQQKRLMADLVYCDPVSQGNTSIQSIRILSASDDSVLSSYEKIN